MRSFGLRLVWIMVASVGVVMATFSAPSEASGKAGLRILCDGEARNADVTINGKPFGSCPMDIEIPAGLIDLQVSKTDSGGDTRIYREKFSLISGASRRIEVLPSLMKSAVNQTKNETIEWIREKLKQEIVGMADPHDTDYIYRDVQFSIDDINGVIELHSRHKAVGLLIQLHERKRFSFRINEVTKVYLRQHRMHNKNFNFLGFDIFPGGECTLIIQRTGDDDEETSCKRGFTFYIKNSEPDLGERFNNAFGHLRSFYPPPGRKRREAF